MEELLAISNKFLEKKQYTKVYYDEVCGLSKDRPWVAKLVTETAGYIHGSSRSFPTKAEAQEYEKELQKEIA